MPEGYVIKKFDWHNNQVIILPISNQPSVYPVDRSNVKLHIMVPFLRMNWHIWVSGQTTHAHLATSVQLRHLKQSPKRCTEWNPHMAPQTITWKMHGMKSAHQKLPVGSLTSNSKERIYSSADSKIKALKTTVLSKQWIFMKSDFLISVLLLSFIYNMWKEAFYLDTFKTNLGKKNVSLRKRLSISKTGDIYSQKWADGIWLLGMEEWLVLVSWFMERSGKNN